LQTRKVKYDGYRMMVISEQDRVAEGALLSQFPPPSSVDRRPARARTRAPARESFDRNNPADSSLAVDGLHLQCRQGVKRSHSAWRRTSPSRWPRVAFLRKKRQSAAEPRLLTPRGRGAALAFAPTIIFGE
jgi:hypothetical protein